MKEGEKMNDIEICKKCIYYDNFCCQNDKTICINNSEYKDAKKVVENLLNRMCGETE